MGGMCLRLLPEATESEGVGNTSAGAGIGAGKTLQPADNQEQVQVMGLFSLPAPVDSFLCIYWHALF